MALPALSQRLLVNQTVMADPSQPKYANFDALSGTNAALQTPGVAAVTCEKLGLLESTHYIKWGAGVTAGEITIETSSEVSDTDPWPSEQVINFADANLPAPRQDKVRIQGTHGAYRHRITVPIQGGTVTTKIVAST